MPYKHTQKGTLIIYVSIVVAILFGWILMQADFEYSILAIMAVVLFLLASFSSLNVEIDEKKSILILILSGDPIKGTSAGPGPSVKNFFAILPVCRPTSL